MKLALCSLLFLTAGPAPPQSEDPFPKAQGPLTIPAEPEQSYGGEEERWTVRQLVDEYARVTNQVVQITKETDGLLQNTTVGLNIGIHVPPENVHTVVESLLMRNDFFLRVVHPSNPRILGIDNLNTGARNTARQSAITVAPTDLHWYADHPAFLVSTSLTLDALDVRTLANSLRTMLTDANTQNIIPVGSSNSIILTGFGPQVASLAKLLKHVDEDARKHQKEAPPAPDAAKEPDKVKPSHER